MASGLSLLLTGDGKGGLTPRLPPSSGISEPGDAKSLVVSDLNGDSWPDIAFGLNNAPMSVFLAQPATRTGKIINVRLNGKTGNSSAIGARVTLTTAGAKSQTAEVQAGSGYLSQSPSILTFGLAEGAAIKSITVRWPNGRSSSHEAPAINGHNIELAQPSKN